jgi:hypothetical protein
VVRNHYQAKLAGDEHRRRLHDRPGRGGLRDQRAGEARLGDRLASRTKVGTVGGKVPPGQQDEAFAKASKVPVHVPLSGKTMEFDAGGKCTAGC